MNVLVIGGGAREHALAWNISQSPEITKLYIAPGNAGTSFIANNIPIRPDDIKSLYNTAKQLKIDITIVGPEIPLSLGIVDYFKNGGLRVFGPSKTASRIESSKVFSKDLMLKYGIPCAAGYSFSTYETAKDYIRGNKLPLVIKADGLAAGKGVIIAYSQQEAINAISDIMQRKIFGTAGDKILIEEFLNGKEVSLLAFTDGDTIRVMVPACDYKRVFDNDEGPNTGGMGSYSPPSFFDDILVEQIVNKIIEPTIKGMAQQGIVYRGVLYTGLIITDEGPKVLEFNARFGDPETQAIIPRLKTDLLSIIDAIENNELNKMDIEWYNNACVAVVMASDGYPGEYKTAFPITGLNNLDKDIIVYHAGTRINDDMGIVTDGGRVITVTATGQTMKAAREKVYKNINNIHFQGCHFRKDIALREVI